MTQSLETTGRCNDLAQDKSLKNIAGAETNSGLVETSHSRYGS